MFFDAFRRSNKHDMNPYVTDDFGEWMMINHNKELLITTNLLSRAIRKSGIKNFDIYLGYFSTDERIKSLISVKGMAVSKDNKRNVDIRGSMKNVAGEDAIVVEDQPTHIANICSHTFMFFSFVLLLKKGKEYRYPVKLLLPPMGVDPSEIPLSFSSLFKVMLERNIDASCSINELDAGEGSRVKLVATCRTESTFSLDRLRSALSYFTSEDPKLFAKRVGNREMEVSLYIQQINVKTLIPLLWNNFLDQLRC